MLLLIAATGCHRSKERSELTARLRQGLEQKPPPFIARWADGGALWKELQRFYEGRNFAPAWSDGGRPNGAWERLTKALDKAADQGLEPAFYDVAAIHDLRGKARRQGLLRRLRLEPAMAAEADLRLSHAFLRYASHLLDGLTAPSDVDATWPRGARHKDLAELLGRVVADGNPDTVLAQSSPAHPAFRRLVDAHRRYRELEQKGGWPTAAPPEWSMAEGSPLLARLTAEDPDAGGDLAAALARFQARHGLEPTGILDARTRQALSAPVAARIEAIDLALDRWRWLPDELGTRYVIVNIPAYEMFLVDGGKVDLQMRVIVGEKDKPTPVFTDAMTHVIFNPTWNVPESIVVEEMLPALEDDEDYLEERNIEVVRDGEVIDPDDVDADDLHGVVFRQRPGSDNALGLVKFVFPNHFNIYLHDTPTARLFARSERALSHGCVRLEKPAELARHVLSKQDGWPDAKIREAMDGGDEKAVKLAQPLPVYLVYWTSWADDAGTVHFRPDVYGYDRTHSAVMARLRERAPAPVRAAAS